MVNTLQRFLIRSLFLFGTIFFLTIVGGVLFAGVVYWLPGSVSSVSQNDDLNVIHTESNPDYINRSLPFFYLGINYHSNNLILHLFPVRWNGADNFFHRFWIGFIHNKGESKRLGKTVFTCIWEALPTTLLISIPAWFWGTCCGVLAGVFISQHYWQRFRSIFESIIITNWVIPSFWIGTLAIVWFSKGGIFPIFPTDGITLKQEDNYWAIFCNYTTHLCLPILTEGFGIFWFVCKITQTQCLNIQQELWWKVLISKGLQKRRILWHLIPHLRLQQAFWSAQVISSWIVGTLVIEILFNLPGIGFLFINSLYSRDYPIIVGLILFFFIWSVAAQLLGKWLVQINDPRILRPISSPK